MGVELGLPGDTVGLAAVGVELGLPGETVGLGSD